MLVPTLSTSSLNYYLFSSFFLMKFTENVFIVNDITHMMYIECPVVV